MGQALLVISKYFTQKHLKAEDEKKSIIELTISILHGTALPQKFHRWKLGMYVDGCNLCIFVPF